MNTNELMIGNLVYGNKDNPVKIDKIVAEWNNVEVRGWYLHDRAFGASNDSLRPIPLTEEWLLKLEFEQNLDSFFNEKINLYLIKPFPTADYFLVKSNLGDKITSVKNVHQLQNFYFALTGVQLKIKS